MIREEIKKIDGSPKKLREFGYVVGGVFLLLGGFLAWREKTFYLYFVIAGLVLIIPAFLFPKSLKPVQKIWMSLAIVMGAFVSRVLLGVLYYFVITPIGLMVRLSGKDFMNRRFREACESYWVDRSQEKWDPKRLEQQF